MDNATLKRLAQIAREQIIGLEGRSDLEPRNNDEEDFIEVSIWDLKAALAAAYELGKKDADASIQAQVYELPLKVKEETR